HQSPYILIHFQYDAEGELSSPQVPTSNTLDLAESKYTTPEQIDRSRQKLEELSVLVPYETLNGTLEEEGGLLARIEEEETYQQLPDQEPLSQYEQQPVPQQAYAPELFRQQLAER